MRSLSRSKERKKKRSIETPFRFPLTQVHRLQQQVLKPHAAQVAEHGLCSRAEESFTFAREAAGGLCFARLFRSRRHCDFLMEENRSKAREKREGARKKRSAFFSPFLFSLERSESKICKQREGRIGASRERIGQERKSNTLNSFLKEKQSRNGKTRNHSSSFTFFFFGVNSSN